MRWRRPRCPLACRCRRRRLGFRPDRTGKSRGRRTRSRRGRDRRDGRATSARSSGQSTKGGKAAVAGKPRRIAAVGSNRRRSTTALVKCVVPIITPATSAVVVPDVVKTCRSAVVMPLVTSSVVGVLILATTAVPSINTASVFVPPTSIPMRNVMRAVPSPQRIRLAHPTAIGPVGVGEYFRGPPLLADGSTTFAHECEPRHGNGSGRDSLPSLPPLSRAMSAQPVNRRAPSHVGARSRSRRSAFPADRAMTTCCGAAPCQRSLRPFSPPRPSSR